MEVAQREICSRWASSSGMVVVCVCVCVCVCAGSDVVVMVFGCGSSRCLAIGAGRVWLRPAAQQHHDDRRGWDLVLVKCEGRAAERCCVKGLGLGVGRLSIYMDWSDQARSASHVCHPHVFCGHSLMSLSRSNMFHSQHSTISSCPVVTCHGVLMADGGGMGRAGAEIPRPR
jgi:hypothetical protein